eukprot:2645412-Pleurochrysis_carterae.AAC.2
MKALVYHSMLTSFRAPVWDTQGLSVTRRGAARSACTSRHVRQNPFICMLLNDRGRAQTALKKRVGRRNLDNYG